MFTSDGEPSSPPYRVINWITEQNVFFVKHVLINNSFIIRSENFFSSRIFCDKPDNRTNNRQRWTNLFDVVGNLICCPVPSPGTANTSRHYLPHREWKTTSEKEGGRSCCDSGIEFERISTNSELERGLLVTFYCSMAHLSLSGVYYSIVTGNLLNLDKTMSRLEPVCCRIIPKLIWQ